MIPLKSLKVSEENIRKELVDREKDALKKSIRALNVLDALTVIYNEDEQTYEIIKGQRRFLAALELQKEGFSIKELPCVVKVREVVGKPEGIEECLTDELLRCGTEANDIGRAVQKMVAYYSSVNKVSQQLGVAEDWLNYYLQHLNLNEPAKAQEATSAVTPKSLEDFDKQEPKMEPTAAHDPLADFSLEERKEAERRIAETPKVSIPVIKSATKDWMDNSREFLYRVDEKNFQALSDWAKNGQAKVTLIVEVELPTHEQGISIRRAMDILVNELLKEALRKLHFRT
jgi:ParB family chromosome partitioning protein